MRSNRGTPVYKFEWSDRSRRTDDEDAFEVDDPPPDAVMTLADIAREDDDCEVTMVGMEN